MVAGMLRHMRSLRTMRRDHGRIHTLLEEAENERMHLLTFLQLAQPGLTFRSFVLLAQVRSAQTGYAMVNMLLRMFNDIVDFRSATMNRSITSQNPLRIIDVSCSPLSDLCKTPTSF